MEKKEIKKVWRFYTIADYEKEENFLNEMASDSFRWRFKYIMRSAMDII